MWGGGALSLLLFSPATSLLFFVEFLGLLTPGASLLSPQRHSSPDRLTERHFLRLSLRLSADTAAGSLGVLAVSHLGSRTPQWNSLGRRPITLHTPRPTWRAISGTGFVGRRRLSHGRSPPTFLTVSRVG
ncbi:hypothetical protein NDU88_002176 [Pleurodeles waltl]|uniref:Secreted protein n=1 Tax=Pleurodeles waltl TaxID=8319 RepID=A0AAV7T1H4_PLEWA|nr:hypothetical protein NDU88_002176 [Pleurodeles waltl]